MPARFRDLLVRDNAQDYMDEFHGWVAMLLENHILYDVFTEALLDRKRLKKYHMLILPSVECLSNNQVKAIDEFVKSGGLLIATGKPGLSTENGKKKNNFALAQILGVSYQSLSDVIHNTIYKQSYMVPEDNKPWIVLPQGHIGIKTDKGTNVLMKVGERPCPRLPIIQRIVTESPALVSNAVGRGRTYYFASLPGLTYARYQFPDLRKLV